MAAAFALAAFSGRRTADGARTCSLPSTTLATAQDTAAFCAEAFVERNGYTELPGTSDREMIALEPWDHGRTLVDAVEARRRTLARGAVIVCATSNGFSVVFRAYDPMDSKSGHVVVMGKDYDGHAAARGLHAHGCRRAVAARGSDLQHGSLMMDRRGFLAACACGRGHTHRSARQRRPCHWPAQR